MSNQQLILYDKYYDMCIEVGYTWPTMKKDIEDMILKCMIQ
tara:strand:- start:236 stop:358 length:123 start_codon:yes stop_codon:yes gene_type:complete